jgi:hypothetical protein
MNAIPHHGFDGVKLRRKSPRETSRIFIRHFLGAELEALGMGEK